MLLLLRLGGGYSLLQLDMLRLLDVLLLRNAHPIGLMLLLLVRLLLHLLLICMLHMLD